MLYFTLHIEKNENKQKEAGFCPLEIYMDHEKVEDIFLLKLCLWGKLPLWRQQTEKVERDSAAERLGWCVSKQQQVR